MCDPQLGALDIAIIMPLKDHSENAMLQMGSHGHDYKTVIDTCGFG